MQGEPVAVTAKATQALALVLQELATNAVKYGALSVPDGKASVAWWRVDAAAKPEQVRLVWRESGGPPAALPPAKGFGLSLLQDMAALELGARSICAFLPEASNTRWRGRLRCQDELKAGQQAQAGYPARPPLAQRTPGAS